MASAVPSCGWRAPGRGISQPGSEAPGASSAAVAAAAAAAVSSPLLLAPELSPPCSLLLRFPRRSPVRCRTWRHSF